MIVVDTGPVMAMLDTGHAHHVRCCAVLAGQAAPPVLPVTVFTEVCQHLERRGGFRAQQAFLSDVGTGLFDLVPTVPDDLGPISALVGGGPERLLGMVQASVIVIAQRLAITAVATLDPALLATVERQDSFFTEQL